MVISICRQVHAASPSVEPRLAPGGQIAKQSATVEALLSLTLQHGYCGEPTGASSPPILDRIEGTHTHSVHEEGGVRGQVPTCSRRHLSTAHSTSHAALSLAYCCCSRSRACSSSRSSERKSSSRALRALKSCWFSTTCGNRARLGRLTVSEMGSRGAQSVGAGAPDRFPAEGTGGWGLRQDPGRAGVFRGQTVGWCWGHLQQRYSELCWNQ